MNNQNLDIMRHFPDADTLPDHIPREVALNSLYLLVEAARAGVDEITARSPDLAEEELLVAGSVAEQLGANATRLHNIIDK